MVAKHHTPWTLSPTSPLLIRCAICNKIVDVVTVHYERSKQTTVYTVYCHGKVDVTIIKDDLIVRGPSITAGVAFKTKRLTE